MPRKLDYLALQEFLKHALQPELQVSFAEVEHIISPKRLPASAKSHQTWWSNTPTHSHARMWLDVGWRTRDIDLNAQKITFYKANPARRGA